MYNRLLNSLFLRKSCLKELSAFWVLWQELKVLCKGRCEIKAVLFLVGVGWLRQMLLKHTLSSPFLCSSIKFCQPDQIINFTGLVDSQENDKKYKSILIANQSKYLDSEVQFCQLWGKSPEEGNRGGQDEQDSSYPGSARASLVAPITHFSSFNLLLLIWR